MTTSPDDQRSDGQQAYWWHIAWATFMAWSPGDARGSWGSLAAFYAEELPRIGGEVALSEPLPSVYRNLPPPQGCVRLSPQAQAIVKQELLELAVKDRVAGDTPVRCVVVRECDVQALIACPEASLQQRVGRLKSRSAGMPAFNPGPRTWARGFWRAKLLNPQAVEAASEFLQKVAAESGSHDG